VSKAVLGQTATTDSVTGGLGSGKEHRQVQEDIERADAKSQAAAINRDLIRAWIKLEFDHGGQFPQLKIGRSEETDVKLIVDSVDRLVPKGLKVGQNQMRAIIGIGKPDDGDELLAAPATTQPGDGGPEDDAAGKSTVKPGDKPCAKPGDKPDAEETLHQQEGQPARMADEIIADAALDLAGPAIGDLVDRVRAIVASAGSLDAAVAALERQSAAHDAPAGLVEALRQAMLLAWLSGEASEAGRGRA
jgi:phage gp29-like protein